MPIKKAHYISGITITIFIGLHLFNHCFSIFGANTHIEVMTTLRYFYRNIFVETILLLAVATQIFTGLNLFRTNRQSAKTFFEKLQIWTGLYLAVFFIPYYGLAIISFFGHISAIHNKKMKKDIFGLKPNGQSKLILTFGIVFTFVIFYGLTNHFHGVKIRAEYNVLIGK